MADLQAAEGPPEEAAGAQDSGQAQKGMAGMGANLVSTVRSFLPFVSKTGDAQPQPAAGKKPVKVHNTPPADVNNQELMASQASRSGVCMTQNPVNAVRYVCRSGFPLIAQCISLTSSSCSAWPQPAASMKSVVGP